MTFSHLHSALPAYTNVLCSIITKAPVFPLVTKFGKTCAHGLMYIRSQDLIFQADAAGYNKNPLGRINGYVSEISSLSMHR